MSLRKLVLMAVLCALLSSCKGAVITLSPSGMVSVCPGGQILLTCERISGSILYWDISVPMATPLQRIVLSQGSIVSTDFRIGFTEFDITRTSDSPLISQLLISNVTTNINVYCSDDGNENNSPMTVVHKDDTLQSVNRILDVSMMNHFLRNGVIVTLQWPREAGAVYHVNVSPFTEFTKNAINDSIVINLTISYNIQYNVSIVSSLCGVTTTKVLNYVACDDPPTQSLQDRVMIMDKESDIPIIEGQFITYTCPSGFILTGPNASECTRNREWEPDPGQVDCIADCGVPPADRNIKLDYSSTLEGSVLTLICENEMSNANTTESDAETLNVTCDSNGRWIPDPADFIESCSPSTTQPPEIQTGSSALIIGSALGVLALVVITVIIVVSVILCSNKKDCLSRKSVNSCRLPESESIQLGNTHRSHYVESPSGQPDHDPVVVQQDTLVYADIGPSSFKNRGKPKVTLKPVDTDDRVEYALLNHRLQKQAITTNQDSIADDSLDLDTLLIQVRGAVTPHWYQLGQALEVSKDVLDKCTNYPPEESIVEVLDQWLRNFPGCPTWRHVANALRRIGFQQLADDIEMVYETGKLPIDNNDSQQVLTITALELPHQGEETESESAAPPLPPKPPAGSGMLQATSVPPRPPKFVQNDNLQNWN